jgi:hypothetical protein
MTAAVVQKIGGKCSPGTNFTCTLTGVSSSNILLFFVASQYQPYTQSGWTLVYSNAPSGGWGGAYSGLSVYLKASPSAGSNSALCSNATSNYQAGVLVEVSGTTSSTADVKTLTNASGTPTSISVSSGTLAQANEIIFAGMTYGVPAGSSNAAISNPPTGFTSLYVDQDTLVDLPIEVCYQVVTATTSVTASWSWTDTTTNGAQAIIVSYKGTAAPTTFNSYVVNCGF